MRRSAARLVVPLVLAIGAVYAAIGPHEFGHSVVAYVLGCKASPWQTDVSGTGPSRGPVGRRLPVVYEKLDVARARPRVAPIW